MKFSSFIMAVGLIALAPSGMADQQFKSGDYKLAVVELYTSEGCSSCPPADEFLSRLGSSKESAQIVPLAFHVDYWDYIGWKDPYAKAAYTSRQRIVAKVNQQSSIYTPEFVVDGAEARGSRKITSKVKAAYRTPAEVDITLNLSNNNPGTISANVSIDNLRYQGSDTPEVYLAVYENNLSSSINAGENRGRKLEHDYVVRHLSQAEATADGQQHQFKVKLDSKWNARALGVAVVVKLRESGSTLQALKATL